MIYVATGHRPDKLEGYTPDAQSILEGFAFQLLWGVLDEPNYIITGMAQGWDQAIASACIRAQIPFLVAIPCDNFEAMWPRQARDKYRELLKYAAGIKVVCPGSYAIQKMQLRNQWMVDQAIAPSDKVIALWDGSPGGTKNCIEYVKIKATRTPGITPEVVNVWDKWKAYPKLVH